MHMKYLTIVLAFCTCLPVFGQQYPGIAGSVHQSALSIQNNPAASVHSNHTWDMQIIGLQAAFNTNVIRFRNFNLFSKLSDTIFYDIKEGRYQPRLFANGAFDIFSLRIGIKNHSAIAFSSRIRNYSFGKMGTVNVVDTVDGVNGFFRTNAATPFLEGAISHNTFTEQAVNYSTILVQRDDVEISVGLTAKLWHGVAGATTHIQRIYSQQEQTVSGTRYQLISGTGALAYSSTIDPFLNTKLSTNEQVKQFVNNTTATVGGDIGFQMVKKWYGTNADDPQEFYNYKLGVAILDIGSVKYKHSVNSFSFNGFASNIYDTSLQHIINNVNSIERFKDSVSAIANTTTPTGTFAMRMPTRLQINVDKYLAPHVYVNAQASIPLTRLGMARNNAAFTSWLHITPRYERRNLGVYVPTQLTHGGNIWVGLGIKLGPLIMGVHNVGWLFGKNAFPNGGGYFTFIIKGKRKDIDTGVPCP